MLSLLVVREDDRFFQGHDSFKGGENGVLQVRKAQSFCLPKMQAQGQDDKNAMKVVDYEKVLSSANCSKDIVRLEATDEELESLKSALRVVSEFENAVCLSFMENRGYSPSDSRYSDTFKEIHFWFRDGSVMATIRTGSVG